jgi:hypothetical protein
MSRNLLQGATCYLSGPMDFVADRKIERTMGWRNRVTQFLECYGCRTFDPWYKPVVRNLGRYGEETDGSVESRDEWTYSPTEEGAQIRRRLARGFWPVMHIDLRMVDLSDFVIATCPTNLYSVGTPHEIVVARQQRKPVLLVSPPLSYLAWEELRKEANKHEDMRELMDRVERELQVKPNPTGIPSTWYMSLVDTESFFDGFGYAKYMNRFDWKETEIDNRENLSPPARPLLPFLESLSEGHTPRRWNGIKFYPNDDWLLLEQKSSEPLGEE